MTLLEKVDWESYHALLVETVEVRKGTRCENNSLVLPLCLQYLAGANADLP